MSGNMFAGELQSSGVWQPCKWRCLSWEREFLFPRRLKWAWGLDGASVRGAGEIWGATQGCWGGPVQSLLWRELGKDRTGVGAIGASAFCSPLPRGSLWRLTTNMHTNSVHKPCCSNSSLKNWFPHLPLIYKPQLPLIPAAKTYKLPHNFLNTMPYFILK